MWEGIILKLNQSTGREKQKANIPQTNKREKDGKMEIINE